LARHRYFKQPHTPGLWKHVSCPVWFNSCVDDFGIKYIGHEHLQHLYDALRKETYKIVEDLEGALYCGIVLNWNYAKHHVDLAMVKYVMKQLTKYGHFTPLNRNTARIRRIPSSMKKKTKHFPPLNDSPLLDKARKK
jgi:hypothetical protein